LDVHADVVGAEPEEPDEEVPEEPEAPWEGWTTVAGSLEEEMRQAGRVRDDAARMLQRAQGEAAEQHRRPPRPPPLRLRAKEAVRFLREAGELRTRQGFEAVMQTRFRDIERGQAGKAALSILHELKKRRLWPPSAEHVAAALLWCERDRASYEAGEFLEEVLVCNPPPVNDDAMYRAVAACERQGKWQGALDMLRRIEEAGIQPSAAAIAKAMHACGSHRKWQCALGLLAGAGDRAVAPDVRMYTAALRACANSYHTEFAQELGMDMAERGVAPDEQTWAEMMRCSDDEEQVLQLMDNMRARQVKPGHATYGALIGSCPPWRWKTALTHLSDMRAAKLKPVEQTYVSVAEVIHKSKAHWSVMGPLMDAASRAGAGRGRVQRLLNVGQLPEKGAYAVALHEAYRDTSWQDAFWVLEQLRALVVHPGQLLMDQLLDLSRNCALPGKKRLRRAMYALEDADAEAKAQMKISVT